MTDLMKKLDNVIKPVNEDYWKQLKEDGACAGGCTCAASSCAGACASTTAAGEGSAPLGAAPTPGLSMVSGAMINGIPVAGKSVKKKKKKKKNEAVSGTPFNVEKHCHVSHNTTSNNNITEKEEKSNLYNEEFDELEVRQMLTQSQSEENAAIQSYLDKAKKCKELGVPELEKLFMELAKDETVHTGCLQGALANYELDNIEDVLDGEKEAMDILGEEYSKDIEEIVWRMEENFNEKYEEITSLIAKQLDRMNFVYANTEDIIYKKEGEYKYLLKFDNKEGYLKFKVSKDDDVLVEKEWKLEEGEDISPIFQEIEEIYTKYGI